MKKFLIGIVIFGNLIGNFAFSADSSEAKNRSIPKFTCPLPFRLAYGNKNSGFFSEGAKYMRDILREKNYVPADTEVTPEAVVIVSFDTYFTYINESGSERNPCQGACNQVKTATVNASLVFPRRIVEVGNFSGREWESRKLPLAFPGVWGNTSKTSRAVGPMEIKDEEVLPKLFESMPSCESLLSR